MECLEECKWVEGFLAWILIKRKLQQGTVRTHIQHLLTELRYLCATKGVEVEQHRMYKWITAKWGAHRSDTVTSKAHHSWESLQERKAW